MEHDGEHMRVLTARHPTYDASGGGLGNESCRRLGTNVAETALKTGYALIWWRLSLFYDTRSCVSSADDTLA